MTLPGSERLSRHPWNFLFVKSMAVQSVKVPGCVVWILSLHNVLKVQWEGLRWGETSQNKRLSLDSLKVLPFCFRLFPPLGRAREDCSKT